MSVKQKVWKTAAQFSTYDEADSYRNNIIQEHTLVKVRRVSVKGTDIFRVKYWDTPTESKLKKQRKKNKK